jgi:prepilin-type N-terminal cleavage/methylation domain-containing protein
MTTRWPPLARPSDGFTLVEVLVATTIALVVTAVVLGLAAQVQRAFHVHEQQSDVQQRIRVAIESLQRDLLMAGAGTYAGPARGPLNGALAAVMPYRAFGDASDQSHGVFFRRDAISLLYVPETPAQARLASPLPVGTLDVSLTQEPNCPAPTSTRVCGLDAGRHVMVFDQDGHWDVFAIDGIGGGSATLRHRGPPAAAYEAGSAISEVAAATYYLKSDVAAGGSQLFRYDGWASDQPVVDDVVALTFEYFGEARPPQIRMLSTGTLSTSYGPVPPPIGEVRGAWPAGENCTFAVVDGDHWSRLPELHATDHGLVGLTPGMLTDGPWCPDETAPNRFDADLLRVRRIRVTVRVQSSVAMLRGPAGALFLKGGTSRAADQLVPDLQVQFDVAPRNLDLRH